MRGHLVLLCAARHIATAFQSGLASQRQPHQQPGTAGATESGLQLYALMICTLSWAKGCVWATFASPSGFNASVPGFLDAGLVPAGLGWPPRGGKLPCNEGPSAHVATSGGPARCCE